MRKQQQHPMGNRRVFSASLHQGRFTSKDGAVTVWDGGIAFRPSFGGGSVVGLLTNIGNKRSKIDIELATIRTVTNDRRSLTISTGDGDIRFVRFRKARDAYEHIVSLLPPDSPARTPGPQTSDEQRFPS